MSKWTDFRNAVEAVFTPAAQEAVNFVHNLEADAEAAEKVDIAGAFAAGYTAFGSAVGTLEQKLIAGLVAFGSALLGYSVAIVKQAASETAAENTAPKA